MKTSLECPHCQKTTETSRAPGRQATCSQCNETFRVPLTGAKSKGAEFECPECGELTRSGAAPGQKTTCRGCQAKIRVPLRDADAEDDAPESEEGEARPTVRRTCPGCGEKVPGKLRFCPECRTDIDAALQEQRYGDLEGDRMTLPGMIRFFGLPGGVIAMLVAAVWFAAGMAEGYLYVFPPLLFLIGLAVVIGAIAKGRSRG